MSNEFQQKIKNFSQEFSLIHALPQRTYKIVRCTLPSRNGVRLAQLGLVENATVVVNGKAPLGDPIIVTIQGYLLCLRADQAEHFIVKEL